MPCGISPKSQAPRGRPFRLKPINHCSCLERASIPHQIQRQHRQHNTNVQQSTLTMFVSVGMASLLVGYTARKDESSVTNLLHSAQGGGRDNERQVSEIRRLPTFEIRFVETAAHRRCSTHRVSRGSTSTSPSANLDVCSHFL